MHPKALALGEKYGLACRSPTYTLWWCRSKGNNNVVERWMARRGRQA